MKLFTQITFILLIFCAPVCAKDDLLTFSFNESVEYGYAEGILYRSIKYYLAGQSHPFVIENFGAYKTNKKTNAVGKKDKKACQWVLLSALKSLQQRAKSLGANAVINIKSNFKNKEYSDKNLYQCGAGNIMAGVALKADLVKL